MTTGRITSTRVTHQRVPRFDLHPVHVPIAEAPTVAAIATVRRFAGDDSEQVLAMLGLSDGGAS